MKLFIKIATVTSSLLLVASFISYRAGVFGYHFKADAESSKKRVLIAGSKLIVISSSIDETITPPPFDSQLPSENAPPVEGRPTGGAKQ